MSKIALAGNASGTGTITLESPNTNTDFTINLPAASGTLVTTGGTVTFGAGTAAAPSITNTNDTNTGIYFPAPDTIGFTEGGVEAFRLNSSGEGVFAGNVTAAGNLTVAGTVRVGGITTNVYPLVSGTAQNATGTAVDFTGIPPWVRRVTVIFNNVAATAGQMLVQLGTGGTYVTSGYSGVVSVASAQVNAVVAVTSTVGFILYTGTSQFLWGHMVITRLDPSQNVWVSSHSANRSGWGLVGSGVVTVGGALESIRITTTSPSTSVFNSGAINIMYE